MYTNEVTLEFLEKLVHTPEGEGHIKCNGHGYGSADGGYCNYHSGEVSYREINYFSGNGCGNFRICGRRVYHFVFARCSRIWQFTVDMANRPWRRSHRMCFPDICF